MPMILSVAVLLLMIAALVDLIPREDGQVRHLPKFLWIILVVIMPFVGSLLWFALGREPRAPRESVSFGDPSRWSRQEPQLPAVGGSTEAQLAALEREIAAEEQAERIRQLEAELRRRSPGAD